MSATVPLHLVTGFLGAGKTTALNAALNAPELVRTAIVLNEFGETGLDHLFFETRSNIVELANGCLCCTIRGELADTLADLPLNDIDRVIIETTGLADPVPILQLLTTHPELTARFAFAGMIAFADALQISDQSGRYGEARRQIALADQIFITKLDLIPQSEREKFADETCSLLRDMNAEAPIEPISAENLVLALSGHNQPTQAAIPLAQPQAHQHAHHHATHHHTHGIHAVTLRHEGALPYKVIETFCELLTSAHADKLLRLKGVVAVAGDPRPLAIHCVGGVMHEPRWLAEWPDTDHGTRIVVITDGLQPGFVEKLFAGFAGMPLTDTPDADALTDNPLAIPGHRLR